MSSTPAPGRLRVLMIEDSASDAGLLARHLEQHGLAHDGERVATAAGLQEALARGPWHLVLCDYQLPGFGARHALAAVRAVDAEVPVILVSGVILDEQALELMHEGANDYVMKANLARLLPAVRRELDKVGERQARRHAEAELASVQQWHAAAVASSMDGYATLDGGGRVLEANAAFGVLVGRPAPQTVGATLADFVAAPAVAAAALAEARARGHARFECALAPPSVTQVVVSITCHSLGQAEVFLFMHDVTDLRQRVIELRTSAAESERARLELTAVLEARNRSQQQLRDSEERLRGILENNLSATLVLDHGAISYANPRAAEILGRTREQLQHAPLLDWVLADDRPEFAQACARLEQHTVQRVDLSFFVRRPDGEVTEIGAMFSHAELAGRPVILCSAQDIGERKQARREIDRYCARLEASMQSTLQAVAGMVELRDPYTAGHQRRVGDLAAAIGVELGLDARTVQGLQLAGCAHDIGKISVPSELLSKPGRLTPVELELVRQHCRAGYEVLKSVDLPWPIAQVILQHHERLDGSGYPQQLRGDEIAPESRIVAVADVVEAMSSHRPYRAGLALSDALAEIESGAGTRYDAAAVAACLTLFRDKGYAIPR